jgi:hypothetical protein
VYYDRLLFFTADRPPGAISTGLYPRKKQSEFGDVVLLPQCCWLVAVITDHD